MKLLSTADTITTFLCPQDVSDFEHKLASTADTITTFLCPQDVSDFEHEIGVDG